VIILVHATSHGWFTAATDDDEPETLYLQASAHDATGYCALARADVTSLRDALAEWLRAHPDPITKALQDEIRKAVAEWPEGVEFTSELDDDAR